MDFHEFFDFEAARELQRERRAELEKERLSAVAQRLGKLAADRLKAMYPAQERVGQVNPVASVEVFGHRPQASDQKVGVGGVVSAGHGSVDQPDLDQKLEAGGNSVGVSVEVRHESLPLIDLAEVRQSLEPAQRSLDGEAG
jgi:hypothetical protein